MKDKFNPYSEGAEQGVLASILLAGSEMLMKCRKRKLVSDDFYDAKHQLIYAVMTELDDAFCDIDEITVCERLHAKGELSAAGGPTYIDEVSKRIEVTAHAVQWMEIVWSKSQQRKLLTLFRSGAELAAKPSDNFEDIRSRLAALVDKIATVGRNERGISTGEILGGLVEDFDDWRDGKERAVITARNMSWGIPILDDQLEPMNPYEQDLLIVWGGLSSHGKSAVSRQVVVWNAVMAGKRVAVFLRETTRRKWLSQAAGALAAVNVNWFRPGKTYEAWKKAHSEAYEKRLDGYKRALQALKQAEADGRLHIFDRIETVEDICVQTRAIAKEFGSVDAALVDYLQLLKVSDSATNKAGGEAKTAYCTSMLKGLAVELMTTVHLISALNRDKEIDDEGPNHTHLKGSTQIFSDADRCIFIHCPKINPLTGSEQSRLDPQCWLLFNQAKGRDGVQRRVGLRMRYEYVMASQWPEQSAS